MGRIATAFPAGANSRDKMRNRPIAARAKVEPAESATQSCVGSAGLPTGTKYRWASWPSLRATIGHDGCLAMGSEFDHSNAWSARKRTMVNPSGFTANSLFFT
jgi:hypothetical protein